MIRLLVKAAGLFLTPVVAVVCAWSPAVTHGEPVANCHSSGMFNACAVLDTSEVNDQRHALTILLPEVQVWQDEDCFILRVHDENWPDASTMMLCDD